MNIVRAEGWTVTFPNVKRVTLSREDPGAEVRSISSCGEYAGFTTGKGSNGRRKGSGWPRRWIHQPALTRTGQGTLIRASKLSIRYRHHLTPLQGGGDWGKERGAKSDLNANVLEAACWWGGSGLSRGEAHLPWNYRFSQGFWRKKTRNTQDLSNGVFPSSRSSG